MFVQEKISDPTVSFATNALPADDLPKGQVSMFITHAGSVAQFGPEVMKDLKVVPYPQVNPQKPVSPVYGFALAVNPQIPEAKQKLVHDLIKFVVKDPKGWYEKTAYPYPASNFLTLPGIEDARKTRYLDVFMQDIRGGRFVQRSPQILEINSDLKGNPQGLVDQGCKGLTRRWRKRDASLLFFRAPRETHGERRAAVRATGNSPASAAVSVYSPLRWA